MKRMLACTALGLAAVLPNLAQADGYEGGVYVRSPLGVVGDIVSLPFVAGAAVIGAAATVATAPFYALAGEPVRPPVYVAPRPAAYYAPRVVYAPPRPVYYAPPPAYYGPPRVYYGPPRYYYRPAPVYVPRPYY